MGPYSGLLGPKWVDFLGFFLIFSARKYFSLSKNWARIVFLFGLNVVVIGLGATPPDPEKYGLKAFV